MLKTEMKSHPSGIEIYGRTKLLGIPFLPEFTKLFNPDLYFALRENRENLVFINGMYRDSEGNDPKMHEIPRQCVPLHRSPAVLAALCAIGKTEAVFSGTTATQVTPKSSGNVHRPYRSEKLPSQVRSGSDSQHFVKLHPQRHERTRSRITPYIKRTPTSQVPVSGIFSKRAGIASQSGSMSDATQYEKFSNSETINKAAFSAPAKLNLSDIATKELGETSGDKVRTFAIENLGKRCLVSQKLRSSPKCEPRFLEKYGCNSSEEITDVAGTSSKVSSSIHCGMQCKDISIPRKHCSFRRLYHSSGIPLSPRDVALQRHITNSLNTHGVCVIDHFLGDQLGSEIETEMKKLHSTGNCEKGELVGGRNDGESIRGDLITWVDGTETGCENLGAFCSKLDRIVTLGSGVTSSYNICGGTKAMVAKYPGKGTRYKLHVDNPAKDGRCLSCIYYVNRDWETKTMGGTLRIHAQTSGKIANVAPIFDRIAIFYSDSRNPHEVLPTFEDRYAVTIWYFDHDERARALQRIDTLTKSASSYKALNN